jgi:hypothetical protein
MFTPSVVIELSDGAFSYDGEVAVLAVSESESDEEECCNTVSNETSVLPEIGCCDTDTSCNSTRDTNATVEHIEDDGGDMYTRKVVLDTCTELLLKLETIRLSVLHLQYSLHAGALGSAAVEATDRSQQLWRWGDGGFFPPDIVEHLRLASLRAETSAETTEDPVVVATVSTNLQHSQPLTAEVLLADGVYDI